MTSPTPSERVIQILTIVSGIVALAVSLGTGRPASALAILIAVVGAITVLLLHVWRTKLPSGAYKYTQLRWTSTVAVAIVAISFVAGFSFKGIRSAIFYDLLGFNDPSKTTVPGQIVVGETDRSYKLLVPVLNSSQKDLQVKNMDVTVKSRQAGVSCDVPSIFEYRFRDVVTVQPNSKKLSGKLDVKLGALAGTFLVANGSYGGSSCWNIGEGSGIFRDLKFSFRPEAFLKRDTTTEISIEIPKEIHAYERISDSQQPTSGRYGSFKEAFDLPVEDGKVSGFNAYIYVTVRIRASSSRDVVSCGVLSSTVEHVDVRDTVDCPLR